jgi:folate-dependent tRNA-U54 methylase TrmFO/GidA
LDPPVREKRRRYAAYAERALADLETAIGERPDLGIRGGQSV